MRTNRRPASPDLLMCLAFFVAAVILHVALAAWHTSRFGFGAAVFMNEALRLGGFSLSLLALALGVAGFAASWPLRKPDLRTPTAYLMVLPLAYLAATVVTGPVERMLGRDQRRAVVTRGQEVVLAIGDYERVHTRTPRSLQELVPAYLAGVPSTGMPAHPEFLYERGPRGAWTLTTPVYVPGASHATLLYRRGEQYEGAVERLDGWAFKIEK